METIFALLKESQSLVAPEALRAFPDPLSEALDCTTLQEWSPIEPLELHLSLMRQASLRKEQLGSFTTKCQELAEKTSTFPLEFREAQFLSNETSDTHFLAVCAQDGGTGYVQVRDLLAQVDRIMDHFHLPKYYEQRIPHFSLAWSSAEKPPAQEKDLEVSYFEANVATLHCRVGKKVHSFPLRARE